VGLGIPGLALLLLTIVISLIHAIRSRKVIYIVFLVVFVVSCLTESMLERQSGVVFYSFFNALFAFHLLGQKQNNFE
jgi:O-antigen ligase